MSNWYEELLKRAEEAKQLNDHITTLENFLCYAKDCLNNSEKKELHWAIKFADGKGNGDEQKFAFLRDSSILELVSRELELAKSQFKALEAA